jgi:autotransporter passenger strand-loop-strand repeat protein
LQDVFGVISGTTLLSGGIDMVFSGGVANGASVKGTEVTFGTVSGATADTGLPLAVSWKFAVPALPVKSRWNVVLE